MGYLGYWAATATTKIAKAMITFCDDKSKKNKFKKRIDLKYPELPRCFTFIFLLFFVKVEIRKREVCTE